MERLNEGGQRHREPGLSPRDSHLAGALFHLLRFFDAETIGP